MAEQSFEQQVERDARWNFSVNLVDISFISLGLSLISRETVIPSLMRTLTDSPVVIGLLPAVYSLAMFLPQLLGASYSERMPRKLPFVALVGSLGERVPYLLAGVVVLLFAERAPAVALFGLIALFGMSAASAGFATPAWYDLIAKVIPLRRRGLFSGVGHGLGALMGVAGAALIGPILERWPYPTNYFILFALAGVGLTISWVGLILNREPPSPSVRPAMSLRSYLGRLPAILRTNQNFARYLVATGVVRAATMVGAFLLVAGTERFKLGGGEVGLLTGVLIGAQAGMNMLWGVLGDRSGHKIVLVGGALALAASAALAWLGPSWPWLVAAFVLLGGFLAADSSSFLNIIIEFCPDEERPTYIGLTNTLLTPVVALAPLLGGWLAAAAGYGPMFALAAALAILGAILLATQVREPRHSTPDGGAALSD